MAEPKSPEDLTLDALFDDLSVELELRGPKVDQPPRAASRSAPLFEQSYSDQALRALDSEALTTAGALLWDQDRAGNTPTRPYEIPVEELFGDNASGMLTVPIYLGDLPDEAYPTEVNLPAIW